MDLYPKLLIPAFVSWRDGLAKVVTGRSTGFGDREKKIKVWTLNLKMTALHQSGPRP